MARGRIALMRPSQMFDSFMDEMFNAPAWSTTGTSVDIDMYETDENVIVEVNAPGVNTDKLEVTVEDNVLTVSYDVEEEKEEQEDEKKYYYKEIRKESFMRSVTLPTRVDTEKADAKSEDGIVKITLPKLEEVKPRRVKISTSK